MLGSRISLISKKNIRYEGSLYSVNESDATVALQNVKSYGTEGRELLDTTGTSSFVPPNATVHAYLLFRGQDIKDLHVHEKTNDTEKGAATPAKPREQEAVVATDSSATESGIDVTPVSTSSSTYAEQAPLPSSNENKTAKQEHRKKAEEKKKSTEHQQTQSKQQSLMGVDKKQKAPSKNNSSDAASREKHTGRASNGECKENKPAPQKKGGKGAGAARKNQNMVGTGASLLNKKARGAKGDQGLSITLCSFH